MTATTEGRRRGRPPRTHLPNELPFGKPNLWPPDVVAGDRRGNHDAGPGVPGPLLAAHCWCERSVLVVASATIRAGLTESCGRRGCEDPDG